MQVHDHTFIFHDQGGNIIDFQAANQDTTNAALQYFGFISSFGSWIVQRFSISGAKIVYEYFAGKTRTDYDTLWDGTGAFIGTPTFVTFDQIKVGL